MLDTTFSTYQRSRGSARVALGGDGRISGLYQAGSAKAMLPRTHGPIPEVVFLNTAGGLTGGDRMEFTLDIAATGRAMAATQTAERAYASPGGAPAELRVSLTVGDGAILFWLPQETILFDRAALDRVTEVNLGDGARFLGMETVVLGRAHMGETLASIAFSDARRVFGPNSVPLHAEQMTLGAAHLADSLNPATLAGNTVFSTVTYLAPDAPEALPFVRAVLGDTGVTASASGWDNRLVIRAMGRDSWTLRAALIPAIRYLTGGILPRVWQI